MTSRLDIITDRMSKLMLKRWSMLSDLCPIDGCSAPLMKNPLDGTTKCVWHDGKELFPEDTNDKEEEREGTSYKSENARGEKEPANISIEPKLDDEKERALRERREQQDLAGHLIAKRLLQGWKMIDMVCPNDTCYSVPLVEDRDKMKECVVCENRYIDENDYNKKYIKATTERVSLDVKDEKEEKKKVLVRDNMSSGPSESTGPIEPREVKASVRDRFKEPKERSCDLGFASETLVRKIEQLSKKLEEALDADEVVRISAAIKACAKALRVCRKL